MTDLNQNTAPARMPARVTANAAAGGNAATASRLQQLATRRRDDSKRLLTLLKLTTTMSAVSLTLAGWGLLARAESLSAQQVAPASTTSAPFVAATTAATAAANGAPPAATVQLPTAPAVALALATPTATPRRPTPAPTAPAQVQVHLNVVQWTQTRNGDPVAVVQDNSGVLWYVWGPDVTRIEQGEQPQYQPVQVNGVARTRRS